ncbi:peptide/nickel transport system ATP-binding protein [Rhizobiales bacterium GAS191]|nr:peptide/nickel transport system ATP-binding protein [Rhizobiales bacterium GAS191]SEC82902.1 peptide/nickel transport system ATP-binding protein [Rhizobiales bacterium GAS188]
MVGDHRILSVRDLAVDFAGDAGVVHALHGVNFDLYRGRTLAIVGESGSGKSVTVQAAMGLLPKKGRITRGEILFSDPARHGIVDIAKLPRNGDKMRDIRGGRMAMIFQEPMTSLSPLHTIGDQIGEAARIHREADGQLACKMAADLLDKVGFQNPQQQLNAYPFELSGGMRQRAMIAMALMCQPAILIADEPTTALDVTTQANILSLMKGLQKQFDMGILLITHDLGVVANVADDVAVMYRGEIVERGGVEAIFRDARHPYLKALMRCVPRVDGAPEDRLTPLRDSVPAEPRTPPPGAKPNGTAPVLEVQDVSKSFWKRGGPFAAGSRIPALTKVSLAVKRGETLGIVGESGSGKTTLSKIIMRAMGPDEGRVLYDTGSGPRDIASFEGVELTAYRRAVQFVFQDPFSSLNPRMTVHDILTEPLTVHGVGDGASRGKRVVELCSLVGIDRRALSRYPHSFSGGQRQRIGIARALALEPSVLLCDEPTSALDVSVQAQILNLLKDLQSELGLSLLFVSHNLAVIHYLANDVAVMCRGHVVEQGPSAVMFAQPRHPYTKALLAAVPSADLDHLLDFDKIAGEGVTLPSSWPEPFTIRRDGPRPDMVETTPRHFVRIAGGTGLIGLDS